MGRARTYTSALSPAEFSYAPSLGKTLRVRPRGLTITYDFVEFEPTWEPGDYPPGYEPILSFEAAAQSWHKKGREGAVDYLTLHGTTTGGRRTNWRDWVIYHPETHRWYREDRRVVTFRRRGALTFDPYNPQTLTAQVKTPATSQFPPGGYRLAATGALPAPTLTPAMGLRPHHNSPDHQTWFLAPLDPDWTTVRITSSRYDVWYDYVTADSASGADTQETP